MPIKFGHIQYMSILKIKIRCKSYYNKKYFEIVGKFK